MISYHESVLLEKAIDYLSPKAGGIYTDATLGGGGHTRAILDKSAPDGVVIAIDRDQEAIEHAQSLIDDYGCRLLVRKGDFRDLAEVVGTGPGSLDGVIFDLGVSSWQLDSERGFTFRRDEQLDMRMAPDEQTDTAEDIVNTYSRELLADVIRRYGEERLAGRIASAIDRRRQNGPIQTTLELAKIVESAVGSLYHREHIHPATRTFQAIRIVVNRELEALEQALPAAIDLLRPGARVCAISFHSLEDRIVKNTFRRLSGRCSCSARQPMCVCGAERKVTILTTKPVTPDACEINTNPRARSAKLRCAERI